MKKLLLILLTAVFLIACGCDSIKPYNEEEKSSKTVVSEATESSLDDYKEPDTIENTTSAEQDNTISSSKNASPSEVSSATESKVSSPVSNPVKKEPPLVSNNNSSKKSDDFDGVYYANTNTKKFHKSNCGSAKLIKDSNLYTTTSRDELINDGYVPCLRCNP